MVWNVVIVGLLILVNVVLQPNNLNIRLRYNVNIKIQTTINYITKMLLHLLIDFEMLGPCNIYILGIFSDYCDVAIVIHNNIRRFR